MRLLSTWKIVAIILFFNFHTLSSQKMDGADSILIEQEEGIDNIEQIDEGKNQTITVRKDTVRSHSKKRSFAGSLIKIADLSREVIVLKKQLEEKQKTIQRLQYQNKTLLDSLKKITELSNKKFNNGISQLKLSEQKIIEEKQKVENLKRLLLENGVEMDVINSRMSGLSHDLSETQIMLQRNKRLLMLTGIMLLMSVFLGISIYRNYRNKKLANELLSEKNEEIMQQNEEILAQKEEIERQHHLVTIQRDQIIEQNQEITDSIVYARRIQSALLPRLDSIQEHLAELFVLYLPRNIVSGDYYWMNRKDNQLIIIAADCTGHGVPGAFMSMLGMAFLNEIINQKSTIKANEILNRLREKVIDALKQQGRSGDSKDGMDMALCIIDHDQHTLQYAGAYNPLYLIRNNEIIIIKADNMPVSFYTNESNSFTNHIIQIQNDDCIYMFSDGYCDQFGGPRNKKFSNKRFKELLIGIHQKPLSSQKEILEKNILEWKGEVEQTDDILVLGLKV